MTQLGISAFYHDSAACIVKDGKVIAAVEEERFTEVKHDASFPHNAIDWLLKSNKLTFDDIDQVCWYEDPELKKDRVLKTFKKRWWKTRKLKKKFLIKHESNDPTKLLREKGYEGDIVYTPHHLSHAAFSYLTSPYKKAAVLCVDGVGEWDTVTIWRGEKENLELIDSVKFPTSLGLLYSAITAYLGFKPNEGEYKVMGLAPYGNPEEYFSQLDKVFIQSDKLQMDMQYFSWEYDEQVMFNVKLANLLKILPRLPEDPVEQEHKDLAAALQKIYEREFLKLVNQAKQTVGTDNLCLGGGCAYNGVANAKAYKYFKHIHIPFAPSDAGSAIGACLYNWDGKRKKNTTPFLGPGFTDNSVVKVLKALDVKYLTFESEDILLSKVADLISKDYIIGWFQGKMEFGARALGNRSILANPRKAEMRTKLNYVIKKREGFRPFAPSVLKEQQNNWFICREDIPYMNQVVKVKGYNRKNPENKLPSATHVDFTARVHTVTEEQNQKYYRLLKKLEEKTGYGVVLNTSFNLKDQTITMTPQQAVERFLASDIDYLVINNFLIIK